MNSKYDDFSQKANSKSNWYRDDISTKVIDFISHRDKLSQREFAKKNNVPRTTFQRWLNRINTIDADPDLIAFFESPAGVNFLHLLIQALHFEFTKVGCASIHNICNFLETCELSRFVAASYGTHQRISNQMDLMLTNFGDIEQTRLAKQMPKKRITLCEDETFHPQVCLVGIEPVSNFIVLEKYADDRSGKTWNKAVAEGLANLPVKVLQSTSDEGKGLINHATKGLKGHHSPDLFHVLYEISKGTSVALAGAVRNAEKDYGKCEKATQDATKNRAEYESLEKRPVGRQPDFESKIAFVKEKKQQAGISLKNARSNQENATKAKREISNAYHPYDPLTGEKQDPATVSRNIDVCFDQIRTAADSLADRCKKRIEKAWRVTEKMTATVAFFFYMIESLVQELDLTDEKQELMHSRLIPGFYLQKVAEKEKDPDRKEAIRQKSQELLSMLQDKNGVLSGCSDSEINRMERKARECAGLFQRSSSCVEGRNAQLSLRHHGMHRLSNRKLKALTVIHNYYLRRPDGTTAAERFFENKPIDMFEWLLDNMALPPIPRSKRKLAA
ncbi:MAG: hypothetical protein JRE47_14870 [Deltaproteobacteria bacterium]|nr:hypothetical protein [Deltaproteobacteria bacterium]